MEEAIIYIIYQLYDTLNMLELFGLWTVSYVHVGQLIQVIQHNIIQNERS